MTATAQPAPPAVIDVGARLDRATVARLTGAVDAALAAASAGGDRAAGHRLVLDLGQVDAFDSAGLGAVVDSMRRARDHGIDVRMRGLSEPMLEFFSLVSVERLLEPRSGSGSRRDPITRLGAAVVPFLGMVLDISRTTSQAFRAFGAVIVRPRTLRLDRTVVEVDGAANGALPIVVLIAFLLGIVLAMQAWVQLRAWGAEIYMANMVGVSVVTEIGPLMTAIVLAARSGSSNAAQLGAMVVGEEIDALRQMGVDPVRFLVVPKVLALGFAAVALCLAFDLVAMCGGALFADLAAGIEPSAYREQTQIALRFVDLAVALFKCLTFGVLIGLISCALGLRVRGGSEGVGRATTNAVVLGIFAVIVLDTVFVTLQRVVLP